jgi:hypothetical protein
MKHVAITHKEKPETVATPPADLATVTDEEELLSFYNETGKDGKENVRSDDIIMPRLAILQPTNPQVTDRLGQAGDIFNIVTNVNYSNKGLKFVPLLFYMNRIKWESPDPGAKLECIARDGEHGSKYGACMACVFKEFGQDGSQPSCTEFKNILMIPLPDGESPYDQAPVAFSGKRTAIGIMKNFVTQMMNLRHKGTEMPMYSHIWQLGVAKETNEKGTWYSPQFTNMGPIKDIRLLKYLQSVYKQMQASQAKYMIPQENEEYAARPASNTVEDAEYKPVPETEDGKAY